MKKILLFIIFLFIEMACGAVYEPLRSEGNGLVISSSEIANKIGQDVLDSGGNAFDAAVAVGFALAVVHPAAGNIAGGGFALIHLKSGENLALDFREVAPLESSKNMYLDSNNEVIENAAIIGYKAIGVPGSVKGFSEILARFGSKNLDELLAPSIKLASSGFKVSKRQSETMLEVQDEFKKFAPSSKYFLKRDGSVYKEGEVLVQKDLARTLRILARQGERAFYRGQIARAMVEQIRANGGYLSLKDLSEYEVKWREPLKGSYRGYEIISMPPPSSGGTHILQILNVLENANLRDFNSSETLHLMIESMRQAYADRASFMGDSDFVNVPVSTLISKEYAKKIYKNILDSKGAAIPSARIKAGMDTSIESPQTTHYSIVDKWGNAISVTYTLNKRYGSAVAIEGYGFLMNNQMENFTIKAGVPNRHGMLESSLNEIAPKKRPLSTMSPNMIFKDGRLFMVVGSPGSGKIISTLVQVIVNVIDFKMDIVSAISMPRFHMQWEPDVVYVEKFLLNKDTFDILRAKGYEIIESEYMGDVNAIIIDSNGVIYGSLDPRRKL